MTATATATLRCAIYCRVSSDPKKRWRSVSEQEAECRDFAQRMGWQVVQVFKDNDRSASRFAKKTRPEYERLHRFLAAGKADVLLTWEGSRTNRDLEGFIELRKLLERYNVLWSYDGDVLDMSKARDRKRAAEDATDSEYEAERTRERTLRAVRANAAEGKPHGKIPYGYRREYDPTSGELVGQVIHEEQAAIIREAAKRFLAGETPNAIAKSFNARGIPTARGGSQGWNLTQIRRLLTNPIYVARRIHLGKDVGPATWPAILDQATFDRCVAKFSDPSRKTTHEHAVKFLLSGLMSCGVCGARIRVLRPRGYSSYTCGERFCVARKYEKVDSLITELVIERLSRPDALSLLADDQAGGVDTSHEVAGLRARLEGFYEAAAEGDITPAALAKIEAKLLGQIEALEAEMRSATAIPGALYELTGGDVRAKWEALTLEEQRAVISSLLEIRLLKTRRGARTLDPASVEVSWRTLHG